MPFEEIPHSADWCLRVWAEDLNQLFIESAKGMNDLAGIKLSKRKSVRRKISIASADAESLLVAFLSDLVFLGEHNRLAFDGYELFINPDLSNKMHLSANLTGGHIDSMEKAIKAVTYHNLRIIQTGSRS